MLRPHNWAIPFFEIGDGLRSSAEGKGSLTEAGQRLNDYAFEHLEAKRVMMRIDVSAPVHF
jgi:RimJ/RimL family protein N-acetyltransferase